MRKHGGPPSRRDKHVTLAAISPPGVARGRFVGGQQSGLAGCKPPPLFTRRASSCSSQGRRQGEPWGASPRPSAPTYLPTFGVTFLHHRYLVRVVSGGSHGWGCTSTCTGCNLHWRNCTRVRRMRERVRRLPGGSENIFCEGIDVPQRRGVLLRTGPRGRRLRGVFFALRCRPPLGDSRFFLLFGGSPPRSRFLVMGVFVLFPPPLGHPESGQALGR